MRFKQMLPNLQQSSNYHFTNTSVRHSYSGPWYRTPYSDYTVGWTTGGMAAGCMTGAKCPDLSWAPTCPLFNAYWALFPQGQSGRSVNLTTRPRLVQWLNVNGATFPFPNALSQISEGQNFFFLELLYVLFCPRTLHGICTKLSV